MIGTATIIDEYRYLLTRRWEEGPVMAWAMLNPSTADAELDDHTIKRCVYYARREGAGMISVVNLFALISTEPDELLRHPDPVGPLNDDFIGDMAYGAAWVVFAWGSHKAATRDRVATVERVVRENGSSPLCLGTNAGGGPKHPARLGNAVPLVPWVAP